MTIFRCSEWSFFNIYIRPTDILLLSPHVAMCGEHLCWFNTGGAKGGGAVYEFWRLVLRARIRFCARPKPVHSGFGRMHVDIHVLWGSEHVWIMSEAA